MQILFPGVYAHEYLLFWHKINLFQPNTSEYIESENQWEFNDKRLNLFQFTVALDNER